MWIALFKSFFYLSIFFSEYNAKDGEKETQWNEATLNTTNGYMDSNSSTLCWITPVDNTRLNQRMNHFPKKNWRSATFYDRWYNIYATPKLQILKVGLSYMFQTSIVRALMVMQYSKVHLKCSKVQSVCIKHTFYLFLKIPWSSQRGCNYFFVDSKDVYIYIYTT